MWKSLTDFQLPTFKILKFQQKNNNAHCLPFHPFSDKSPLTFQCKDLHQYARIPTETVDIVHFTDFLIKPYKDQKPTVNVHSPHC